jgi:hypothetical protein
VTKVQLRALPLAGPLRAASAALLVHGVLATPDMMLDAHTE